MTEPTAAQRITHEQRLYKCRSCRAPIIWFKTKAGGDMPVDAATVRIGDTELDLKRHISHFASCPNAAKHRRPRKPTRL